MQESCTYGSVRGARGNSRPYRDATICGTANPDVASTDRARRGPRRLIRATLADAGTVLFNTLAHTPAHFPKVGLEPGGCRCLQNRQPSHFIDVRDAAFKRHS
jgi:hypothetical protein